MNRIPHEVKIGRAENGNNGVSHEHPRRLRDMSFIVAVCNEGRERCSSATGRSSVPTSLQDQRDAREADRTMNCLGYSTD